MSDDFLRNIKWHLFFGKICGIVNVSYKKPENLINRLSYIWPVVLIFTYFLIAYNGWMYVKYNSNADFELDLDVLGITDILTSGFGIICFSFTLIFYIIKCDEFRDILLTINSFDIKVTRARLKSLIVLLVTISFLIIEESATLASWNIYYVLMYSSCGYIKLTEQLLIYEIIQEIKYKIIFVNELLLNIIKNDEYEFETQIKQMEKKKLKSIARYITMLYETGNRKNLKEILKVMEACRSLNDLALKANKLFGIGILFMILMALLLIVFSLQNFYRAFRYNEFDSVTSYVSWMTIFCLTLFITVKSWQSLANEVCKYLIS